MWKWFLYSLILFNVGFFAWNSQRGIPLEKINQSDDLDGGTKLLLLKEQPAAVADNPETITVESCYSIGPLARKTEARALNKKLSNWGIAAKRRVNKTVTEGFWVIIPPAKSRKRANKKIKKLKELGIHDYFLVATGSQKNAISLGVFSKSSSARRRLKEMNKKGITAKITGADLPKRSYWLDWPTSGLALTANQLSVLQKTFKGIGQVSVHCAI